MEKEEMTYKLPEGWIWTTIDEIGIVQSGGTPSTRNNEFWGNEISWITPADLSGYDKKYISKGNRSISKTGLDYSSAKLLPKGTILFSSRAPIGYTVIAKNDLATNQGFKNLIPTKSLNSEYVYYYFQTLKSQAEKVASGTTFLELSATKFSQLPFPLAPLQEQQGIVSKIESLFSELDQAEKGLQKAKQQLEVYRQALLKSAFEGKLTAEWRKDNNPESIEILLKQIENERREHYKQELDDWNAALLEWHKGNKKGRKPVKPRFPSFSKTRNYKIDKVYGKLPDSWTYTVLSEISHYITDGDHQAPKKSEVGIPFITISNIENNIIDFENTFFVSDLYYDSLLDYRKPQKGDVLYTVTGSYGIPVLVDFEKKFCFQRHIGLIRPVSLTNSAWLFYLMQSKQISDQATISATGTAQKTVGLNSIRNFVVPFCSYNEQILIVEKLDSQLSIITK